MAGLLITFLLCICLSSCTTEHTLYVAPDGNDNWSGSIRHPNAKNDNGPLATLTGAQDKIRNLKAEGELDKPVNVIIADGKYAMSEPLQLTDADSGTDTCMITYRAAEEAAPIFSGGKIIRGFTSDTNGLWTVRIPEVAEGKWYFEQLFVNGRRALRARTPNEGNFFKIVNIHQKVISDSEATQNITAKPGDIDALFKLSNQELSDVSLVVYHKWDNTRRFVESVDPKTNSIFSRGKKMKPWNPWKNNNRYHLENYLAALDTPGEWFLSRDGMLYYKPQEGEQIDSTEIIAPILSRFISLRGGEVPVSNIRFEGLSFNYAHKLMNRPNFPPQQAANSLEAVVMADNAENIQIENCSFNHFDRYAVWFRRGCKNNIVRKCLIHDVGAGGVRLGNTQMPKDISEQTSHNICDNNIIYSGGHIYPSAVGVWIGHSSDNQVTHNEIGDFKYTGISVGWRWGYAHSPAKNNKIEFNHIYHIGQKLLSDMGAVYLLGPSEGTRVSNNVIHDVYSYSYGGWGLYTDEGSSGITMENNLVYNVKSGGFHQHYGRDNVIRNNIFAFAQKHQLQATRVEKHKSFSFNNNIVYYREGSCLAGPWNRINIDMDNNCYWNTTGDVSLIGKTLEQWQALNRDKNSIVADPEFINPDAYDFRLNENSPTLAIGFKPFDYTQAGVYGDSTWIDKATTISENIDTQQREIAKLRGPAAKWNPTQIKDEFSIVEFDISPHIKKRGSYDIEFSYTSGLHGLDIKSAALIADDKIVSQDKHVGFAGYKTIDATYNLKLETVVAKQYILRALIKGSAGTNSSGNIHVRHIP